MLIAGYIKATPPYTPNSRAGFRAPLPLIQKKEEKEVLIHGGRQIGKMHKQTLLYDPFRYNRPCWQKPEKEKRNERENTHLDCMALTAYHRLLVFNSAYGIRHDWQV